MRVLTFDGPVHDIRFLPSGRLLAFVGDPTLHEMEIVVHSLHTDESQLITPSPELKNESVDSIGSAIHPSDDRLLLPTAQGLYTVDCTTGKFEKVLPVAATQVILSPEGERGIAICRIHDSWQLQPFRLTKRFTVLNPNPIDSVSNWLLGYLSGGSEFATIASENGSYYVQLRSAATGEVIRHRRYPANRVVSPQLAPDRRHLTVIGYSNAYLYDLLAHDPSGNASSLAPPRVLKNSQATSTYRKLILHPNGQRLLALTKSITLVNVYDVPTLTLVRKHNWKIGELNSIAFNADGTLAAACSTTGQVIVWDFEP